jgi:hypothetical protein
MSKSDDFDFGEARTRIRRAFAEGAKAMSLSAGASKNTGPAGWCAACVRAKHKDCEGRHPLGPQCRCPVCEVGR